MRARVTRRWRWPLWATIACATLAAACQPDGLLVVEVDAATPLGGIARLHVRGRVGQTMREHEVAPVLDGNLPGAAPFTFGMYIPAGLGDTIALRVEARDAGGGIVGSGLGAGPIKRGARTDALVTLQAGDVGGNGGPCLIDTSAFDQCTLVP